MGVPLTRSIGLSDNELVVKNSTIPHSKLTKRQTALSYHHIREAMAAKIFEFFHAPGAENPSDILSRHWSFSAVWRTLQPILFHRGDTMDLVQDQLVETV